MSQLNYPLQAYSDSNLQPIQSQIYQWMDVRVSVHFLLNTHINTHTNDNWCKAFSQALYGKDPLRKIILITPEMETEEDMLVTVYQRGTASAGREVAVGDRKCPFCGNT